MHYISHLSNGVFAMSGNCAGLPPARPHAETLVDEGDSSGAATAIKLGRTQRVSSPPSRSVSPPSACSAASSAKTALARPAGRELADPPGHDQNMPTLPLHRPGGGVLITYFSPSSWATGSPSAWVRPSRGALARPDLRVPSSFLALLPSPLSGCCRHLTPQPAQRDPGRPKENNGSSSGGRPGHFEVEDHTRPMRDRGRRGSTPWCQCVPLDDRQIGSLIGCRAACQMSRYRRGLEETPGPVSSRPTRRALFRSARRYEQYRGRAQCPPVA